MNFIREQNSRQEHEPLLGNLIDSGFAEPLHNSNNGWGSLHNIMLEIAIAKSKIPTSVTELNSLPSLFFVFFFLFQFDKKEKLSYKRTNTTHKYFKVSGTNNMVKTPITVAHYKI